ncbi:hypothetical protein OIU77_020881 [Salix suchowensis]|uniref:Uncharacterized protein n=1 Tax=Salix suchowensis TaxID=1278906 RepID=A0ABQ9CBA0_9ROSI|nr:hypothetical protein OIU77_020881 [Salix suchowensis]
MLIVEQKELSCTSLPWPNQLTTTHLLAWFLLRLQFQILLHIQCLLQFQILPHIQCLLQFQILPHIQCLNRFPCIPARILYQAPVMLLFLLSSALSSLKISDCNTTC